MGSFYGNGGWAVDNILGNFADIEQVIATSNHSVGDYIVVNNKLRKVTAAIASGESIDNNNSSVTTVEAEIASMKNLLGNTSISGIGQGTVTDAISTLNSKVSGFYFKRLESGGGTSVNFTLKGRGTVLAISSDRGGRSWVAVISVTNEDSESNLNILKHDELVEYDPTCVFSGKNVTINVHQWEFILCFSTTEFV